MGLQPFHLAIAVANLSEARRFYTDVLGCTVGREDEQWVDFCLFGHQLVCHQVEVLEERAAPVKLVDGERVPIPHFGVVLQWEQWQQLAERLRSAGIDFLVSPMIRFAGQVGEQATMFLTDPAGNTLEFKAFRDPEQLFAV